MSKTGSNWQTTISKSVSYEGVGLHTGKPSRVTLLPASSGTGICFERCDLPEPITVSAVMANIGSSRRATDLQCDGIAVRTVEHIMAAIVWCGIDNIIVRLDGEELPLGDGSALTYVNLLDAAGLTELHERPCDIRVTHPVWTTRDESHLIALPYEGCRVTFLFLHRRFRPDRKGSDTESEYLDIEVTREVFARKIAPARTIGFEWELDTIQEQGLALGATLDQAVIIGKTGYVGDTRFCDEACRHKVLDLLGDIAILGRVRGHFIGIGSGHSMNHEIIRLIAGDWDVKRGV